jgi:DNA-binding PadR family transcriptional regulator
MTPASFLGEFEHLVLLAVAQLEDQAYGVTIQRELRARAGRQSSLGAIYATLSRLEQKGYLRSWEGGASAKRGGRAKRFFALEPAGVRALRASRRAIDRMWEGLGLDPRPTRL